MAYLAQVVLGNLGLLLIAAGTGWWLVAPWVRVLPQPVLLAPFVGLVVLPAATLVVYVLTGLTFTASALLAVAGLLGLSALSRPLLRPRPGLALLALGLLCVVIVLVSPQAVGLGEPAFFFFKGTDQAGYAQVADWLITHTVHEAPMADIERPLESWPAVMVAADPRFGSFALLALVTLVNPGPALFAYDAAQALVLASAGLAMVGVFGPRRAVVGLMLGLVLVTGVWLELGTSGYFGKILGYPAALILGGLLLRSEDCAERDRLTYAASVVVFALAAGLAYPGHIVALLAGAIGLSGVVGRLPGSSLRGVPRFSLGLSLMAMLSSAFASGLFARPLLPSFPAVTGPWLEGLAVATGVDSLSAPGSVPGLFAAMGGLTLMAVAVGVALAALWARRADAFALAAAPFGLALVLVLSGRAAALPQLAGFAGPAILIASALLVSELWGRRGQVVAALAFCLAIGVGLPLAVVSIGARLPGPGQDQFVIRKVETEGFIRQIGRERVILDIAAPVQWALAFLVTAGNRVDLGFSASSWEALFSYRDWPPPPEDARARFRIVAATAVLPEGAVLAQTHQFVLVPAAVQPLPGYHLPEALGARETRGLWSDGWLAGEAEMGLAPGPVAIASLVLDVPGGASATAVMPRLTIRIDGAIVADQALQSGLNRLSFPLAASEAERRLTLSVDTVQPLAAPDTRSSGARLIELTLDP
jgi:hypothetical protein